MRYIGSKKRLLDFIQDAMSKLELGSGQTICDIFCGTCAVARLFKEMELTVIANDCMEYAYSAAVCYIENDTEPHFTGLEKPYGLHSLRDVLKYLNNLPPEVGFIQQQFSPLGGRRFFTEENAGRIDAIRTELQTLHNRKLLTRCEFYILLTALIDAADRVANTAGTYGAFLKKWQKNATENLTLQPPHLITNTGGNHRAYRADALKIALKERFYLLYLDPPYNRRDYAANYHIPEIIARYSEIASLRQSDIVPRGKTGLLALQPRSDYCNPGSAAKALHSLLVAAKESAGAQCALMSYNSEGLIPQAEIREILSSVGQSETYQCIERDYRRYRADSRPYKAESVKEQLHFVRF